MTKLRIENRLNVLKGRSGKKNQNIINKLERQLRNMGKDKV